MPAPARVLLLLPVLWLALGASPAPDPRSEGASERGAAAWGRQDYAAAAEAYAEVVADDDGDLQAWFRLGYALHTLGRYAEAAVASERAAVPGATVGASAGYNAACAYALSGDTDAALRVLDLAVTLGFSDARLLAADTDLDAVRGDPRFAALWARVVGGNTPDADTLARLRREFDPWLGEWDGLPRVLDPQGKFVDGGWLAVNVVSALEGNALLEYSEGSIAPGTALSTIGYSLRAVDPTTGTWELLLNWPSPGSSSFGRLSGGWRHHRGEFFTPRRPNAQGGAFTRYTFSDVGPDHMRWDSARTQDGGKTWLPDLIFEKTRRPPEAPPLWDGASRNDGWGNTPAFRAYDFALGTWRGTRTHVDAREQSVERRLRSIMEGTLVEEFVSVDGREHEYVIAGYLPAPDAWQAWSVLRDDTTLRAASGALTDAEARFSSAWKDPAHPEQRTIVARDGDALSLRRELRDPDGSWVRAWTETLERVGGGDAAR